MGRALERYSGPCYLLVVSFCLQAQRQQGWDTFPFLSCLLDAALAMVFQGRSTAPPALTHRAKWSEVGKSLGYGFAYIQHNPFTSLHKEKKVCGHH